MKCAVCQSENIKEEFQFAGRKIYCCGNCKTEFLFPQLSDAELEQLYSSGYYKAWGIDANREEQTLKAMKQATFALRLKTISKFKSSGKILDVGCATGFFLEVAQQKRFEPYGVELSEFSAAIAKSKFGNEKVFTGKLEDCPFENNSFDIIAMSDLLEHVRDPIVTLQKAYSLLKPGGLVMIMTPDNFSLSRKIMGRRWTHFKLEHFFYFNSNSIQLLSERTGLEMIYEEKCKKALTIEYFYHQLNIYRHWFLTPFFNTLYHFLPINLAQKIFYRHIGERVFMLQKK